MTYQLTAMTVTEALPILCGDLLRVPASESRNGRVKQILNVQIEITNPYKRNVLNLGRRANVFAQIAETAWVLSGRNDIEWLSAYLPRAKQFSDDGSTWRGGYGPRIRKGHFGKDQLGHVIDLLQKDPTSRRAVIGIYDPAVDVGDSLDIPCNDFLQFQVDQGELVMTVTVRSNDVIWGWSGINTYEWSVLQEIVAAALGVAVGPLVFNIGNLHVYEHHWKRAEEIVARGDKSPSPGYNSPVAPGFSRLTVADLDRDLGVFFRWEEMCRAGNDDYPSYSEMFKESTLLLREWGAAIAYYWTRDLKWFDSVGLHTQIAIEQAPPGLLPKPVKRDPYDEKFLDFVDGLHRTKHASYGDSWKKRGEMMSILANIARKIDRLGVGDEYDTSADTLIDLWVYLAKYLCWIEGADEGPDNVRGFLEAFLRDAGSNAPEDDWQRTIPESFDSYVDEVDSMDRDDKSGIISYLAERVTPIAMDLWYAENEYSPKLGQ